MRWEAAWAGGAGSGGERVTVTANRPSRKPSGGGAACGWAAGAGVAKVGRQLRVLGWAGVVGCGAPPFDPDQPHRPPFPPSRSLSVAGCGCGPQRFQSAGKGSRVTDMSVCGWKEGPVSRDGSSQLDLAPSLVCVCVCELGGGGCWWRHATLL